MRTISNLYNQADIVYIKINNEATAKLFIENALKEGFSVNGYSKFKKSLLKNRVYWLCDNYEIRSICDYAAHIFYYSGISESGSQSFARIDYAKFINGQDDYIITDKAELKITK